MSPSTPSSTLGTSQVDRNRLSVDLSPSVALLLDHVSSVLGTPRSQLLVQALLDALPDLMDRAKLLDDRARSLAQAGKGGKR